MGPGEDHVGSDGPLTPQIKSNPWWRFRGPQVDHCHESTKSLIKTAFL
jgi:hypothetical protein